MKRSGRFRVGARCACLVLLVLTGCVTSPETKLASSQMTAAIDEYAKNVRQFRNAWISEIDKAIADLGKALVARAVILRVNELSAGFEEREEEFKKKGLVELSNEIEEAHEAARAYVDRLMTAPLEDDSGNPLEPADILKELNSENAQLLNFLADRVEEKGRTLKAQRIREYAESLGLREPWMKDRLIPSYAEQILWWRKLKPEVDKRLKNLSQVVAALRESHAAIDAWIQTDVTVSGKQIGQLVVDHQKVLGLEGGK